MAVVFLLIIGMFVDASAAILISTPLLLPALTSAGVDPIHFGLVMVLTLMIGLLTPPVGMSLYMLSDVSGVPLNKTMKSIIPYYIPLLIVLILIVFIPGLATWQLQHTVAQAMVIHSPEVGHMLGQKDGQIRFPIHQATFFHILGSEADGVVDGIGQSHKTV